VGGKIISINENPVGMAIALAMSSKCGVGNSRFRTSSVEGFVDTVAFGAYKRKVFDKVGFFDEELIRNQDDEFNYRLRKYGGKIYLTPRITSWYYPRSSYKKLWKQYYGYGFWKVRVLQKHLRMMQPRQFVPGLFVLGLFALFLAGLFANIFLYTASAVLLFYLTATIFCSINLIVKNNLLLKQTPLMWVCFPILHFSYGLGFLWGNIKFVKRWRTGEK
jgi:GT2 family glycosyltransferase